MACSNRLWTYQSVGLVLGPVIFMLMLFFSDKQLFMNDSAWRTSALGLWMVTWWVTEAIPVAATALLPLICLDLLGISSTQEVAAAYAHPIIYLFLGAFILALAIQRWNLHQRIALTILLQTGTNGNRLIGSFMVTSACLSMWMTNTSTTMMLMPIGISVASIISRQATGSTPNHREDFEVAMLLGLAFAATIGGMTTLVGTPPNALLVAFLADNYDVEISFLDWALIAVPFGAVLLLSAWIVLTKVVFNISIAANEDVMEHLVTLYKDLGSISAAEKRVSCIFTVVVLGWVLRRPLGSILDLNSISDTTIALIGAVLLFLIPSGDKNQSNLLSWDDLKDLPWGVLILFGGGLSLAAAISNSGLAHWLGEGLSPLSGFGVGFLILGAVVLVVFLTEMTSNLATTATFLPIIGSLASEVGLDPLVLCIPITLAASCAFMLPVATAPNAIAFSSGAFTIPQMARAGIYLNCFAIALLMVVALLWAPRFI
ncbi:MAG: anion transporter [Cellvibrionales bacterium TMED49]|nr:anion transporter [Porticoccaceae bacterium]OUU38979.1 MAG: anion transporter [Cellvibrionales bacterium TMED49]